MTPEQTNALTGAVRSLLDDEAEVHLAYAKMIAEAASAGAVHF